MNHPNGDQDPDAEDDAEGEIAITFNLREEDIAKLGLSVADCETALRVALKTQEELDPDDAPAFEEIVLNVAGRDIRLGDIADIEMTTTFDDLDEDAGDLFGDEDDEDFDLDEDDEDDDKKA